MLGGMQRVLEYGSQDFLHNQVNIFHYENKGVRLTHRR